MKATIRVAIICILAVGIAGVITLASKRIRTTPATGNVITSSASASPPGGVAEQTVRITAKNFEFNPSAVTLKKGVPVVLELTSQDREHGFSLRAFGVRSVVKAGETSRVRFTPDKTGEFHFSCDVFCGDGHEDMTGTVIVKE